MARTFGVLGILMSFCWCSGEARADSQNVARAEALFRDGKALYEAERYEQACPRLAESQRLDPAGGTLVALALCYEAWGKLASAWATFLTAQAVAERDQRVDRVQVARTHAEALLPHLSYLTIEVPSALPAAVRITQDGNRVGKPSYGVKTPTDAGRHTIRAMLGEKSYWSQEIELGRAQALTVSVPLPSKRELAAQHRAAAKAAPRAAPSVVESLPARRDEGPARRLPGQQAALRYAGYVLTGAGVTSLAFGGFFGVQAWRHNNEVDEACGSADPCYVTSVSDEKASAHAEARRSTWLFAIGGVAASAGLGLVLWANHSETADTRVSLAVGSGVGLSVAGRL